MGIDDKVAESAKRAGPDFVARAREMEPLLRSHSARIERDRNLTLEVVDALHEAEFWWLLVHRELGGGEVDIGTYIEVLEEVSYADASTGWVLLATAASTAFAAMFCGETAIDAMFGGSRRPIVAGMPGPAGRAIEVEKGFLGGGNYQFASGFPHANWISGGMVVLDNGLPRKRANGTIAGHCAFVPRENVENRGNWDVLGLIGTGSYDYSIPEQFIHRDFMPDMQVAPMRGKGLYELGSQSISCAGHAGWALGVMRRALEELIPLVSNKSRRGYPGHIGEHPHFQHDFAHYEASYRAARAYVFDEYRRAETVPAGGRGMSPIQMARIRQCSTWLHRTAYDLVRFCHLWSGSAALRNGTVLNRLSRDMNVAINHQQFDPISMIEAAPSILQEWDESFHDTIGTPESPPEPVVAP